MLDFEVNLRKKRQIKLCFGENVISGINLSDFLKNVTEFTALQLIFLDFWVPFWSVKWQIPIPVISILPYPPLGSVVINVIISSK